MWGKVWGEWGPIVYVSVMFMDAMNPSASGQNLWLAMRANVILQMLTDRHEREQLRPKISGHGSGTADEAPQSTFPQGRLSQTGCGSDRLPQAARATTW